MDDTVPNQRRGFPKFRSREAAVLAGLVLALLAALAVWMIQSSSGGGGGGQSPAAAEAAFIEETGIRILRVALVADGGMLDLRYQILDPDKAVVAHDTETPPTLVDDDSGQELKTPFHDHTNDRDFRPGLTYFELILNPQGVIRRGDSISVLMGDARLEHVVVE